jgi:hypothetical protein
MAKKLITSKITLSALRLLRLIAAATGEKQYEVLDRVLKAEAKAQDVRLRTEEDGEKDEKP